MRNCINLYTDYIFTDTTQLSPTYISYCYGCKKLHSTHSSSCSNIPTHSTLSKVWESLMSEFIKWNTSHLKIVSKDLINNLIRKDINKHILLFWFYFCTQFTRAPHLLSVPPKNLSKTN